MDKTPDSEPQPSYVKLAMRNMVRKGGTSLKHFALTAVGLLSVLVGLAYLTRSERTTRVSTGRVIFRKLL